MAPSSRECDSTIGECYEKSLFPLCVAPFSLFGLLSIECPSGDEVVCETVHRYGVPLDPQDWSERGQNGQVVLAKDGVAVSRSYQEGILHGECTYTFPHCDVIQKRQAYNYGVLTQETDHYPSGLPRWQVTHESPQKQANIGWYETGAPQAQEEYVSGKLTKGEYYTTNHQIESRGDESNGFRTRRDGQGQLVNVDSIKQGQMVLRTTYHPDGTPSAVTPYVNGHIEGERLTYLPGGEPRTVEQWVTNKQHGVTTVFEQGEKRADVPYVVGVKQGTEKRYRSSNTLAQEVHSEPRAATRPYHELLWECTTN